MNEDKRALIRDQTEVESMIRDVIENRGARLVVIDGIDGCGKTTMTDSLVPKLDAAVIHLDDFVEKNEHGFYLDFIDYEKLAKELEAASSQRRCVIVEGVCALGALQRVGVEADYHVYIKHIKELGDGYFWWDKDRLYGSAQSYEEKIDQDAALSKRWSELEAMNGADADDEPVIDGLRRDIIRYHFDFRPDENANVVFGITNLD